MKVVGNPPQEMLELFRGVCKDYNRGLPSQLTWKNHNRKYSGGTTSPAWGKKMIRLKNGGYKHIAWYGEVIVRAGHDIQDMRLVLLHELAHHIVARTQKGRRQGHSIKFWKLAFELYERYGVDMDYAYNREKNYKMKAREAYATHIQARKENA